MPLSRRLRVLSHWIGGHRNGVSAGDLARFLTGPTCEVNSREYIASQEQASDGSLVTLRGVERPLYWPSGQPMYPLQMVLSETLDARNWHFYEVPETRVAPDDIVADCGAAEGIFALLVQPRARQVYAIEPSPLWTASLQKTFAGVANVTVLPVALGAEPGEAYLSGGALDSVVSSAATSDTHPVTVETIDRLFADRDQPLTYLKADLEGFELSMLAGAERTIARYLPKVAITTYHRREHAAEITQALRRIDPRYRVKTKGIDADTGSPVMLHAWVPAEAR